jgi:ORF6N domain
VRGQRVLLDVDLAAVYGVTTRRLNEQVRRNLQRFPDDFLMTLTNQALAILMSHNATSSWGGRRKLPRAFARLRQAAAAHSQLARELEVLKRSVAALDADTKRQFDQVYEAILGLMASPPRRN